MSKLVILRSLLHSHLASGNQKLCHPPPTLWKLSMSFFVSGFCGFKWSFWLFYKQVTLAKSMWTEICFIVETLRSYTELNPFHPNILKILALLTQIRNSTFQNLLFYVSFSPAEKGITSCSHYSSFLKKNFSFAIFFPQQSFKGQNKQQHSSAVLTEMFRKDKIYINK